MMFEWRDILERAMWTAVQAGLAALPPGLAFADLGAWKVAGIAGITAGLAFLISVVKNMAKQRLEIAQLGEPKAAIGAVAVAEVVASLEA